MELSKTQNIHQRGAIILIQNLTQVTLKKSEEPTTGKAGLAWINTAAQHFGFTRSLDTNLFQKYSPYSGSEKVMPFLLTFIAGGNRIEDIEMLRADHSLKNQLGQWQIASPDTIRNLAAMPGTTAKLMLVLNEMNVLAMKRCAVKQFTFDVDLTFIESQKDSATYNYNKEKSYGALLGFVSELGTAITVDYRQGNVSPANGISDQIKIAHALAEKSGKRIDAVRSDSAGHSKEVMNTCDELGIRYFISMDLNSVVKECIKTTPERYWQAVPEQEGREWTETLYPMGGLTSDQAVRILVLRWKKNKPELFDHDGYGYHVIGTNDTQIKPMVWLEFHNGRMNSENFNKEIKSGFGLDWSPSHNLTMNRNYFLLGLLAYNLLKVFQHFYLPQDYQHDQIRRLRFWFISVCGKLVSHARAFIYHVLNVTEETFLVFKHIHQKLLVTSS